MARILVVDDEATIREILTRRLTQWGHEVEAAAGADAALEMMTASPADIVLCDVMIPEMSGAAIHAEIARRFPDYLSKLLFMTGGAFTVEARAFLEKVPNTCIPKPFDREQLLAAIRAIAQPS